uniref:Integrin beta n=1 Tax=Daphnia magna TaxID=35525 RepID=A0A0P6D6L5_9CRUS
MLLLFKLLVLLGFYLFKWTEAQRSDIMPRSLSEKNRCIGYTTCSECLQLAGCAWCSKKNFLNNGKTLARCNPVDWFNSNDDHLLEESCSGSIIYSTINTTIETIKDEALGQEGSGNQLKPQKILVKTSPHKPVNFQIKFRRVSGYPVDLYYIMDLSTSMKASKEKLVNLAASLADAMRNITTDFRMGFGSFIDKPISPFANEMQPLKPYLFRHHMKLSKDATTFALQVNSAPTFDNLDSPEGGLEALMQAVVCTQEIGWRSNSHRLIIFSTDAPYHLAGDGKLAGISLPNDESCHVLQDGDGRFYYDHFRWLDYPSMAQISRQIANNSMNVIFAVPGSMVMTYRDLSLRLLGASVGELTNDSANIVALVQDQYNKISSSVKLTHRASEYVSVSYSSSCSTNGQPINTNRCDGIKTGSTVTFDVTIIVKSCPRRSNFEEVIEFFPVGVNEVVTVGLDVICQCPCEEKDQSTTRSECSGAGQYMCGYCVCDPDFSGSSCECEGGNARKPNPLAKGCKPPHQGNTSSFPNCSGRGSCICDAACNCHSPPGRKVWGDYCECDDFACPVSPINEQVCSGPEQGTCPCNGGGVCECKPGWQGNSCQTKCPKSQETCYESGIAQGAMCSGRGTCNCGKCLCNKTKDGDPYTGNFCEIPPCKELKECVQCKAFKTGPLAEYDCRGCEFDVSLVKEIKETKEGDQICSFQQYQDGLYCNFFFIHNRLKMESVIPVGEKGECSEPPNVIAIVSGVSGAILAIGLLLLLLWKILTTIHDRLEYAKFLRDRELAKWPRGENPIYKQPTTVFLNPAYTTGSEN